MDLRRELRIQRSKIRTYESAFRMTDEFVRECVGDFSVLEILEAVKQKKKLKRK